MSALDKLLTESLRQKLEGYHTHGYVVLPSVFDNETTASLRSRALKLVGDHCQEVTTASAANNIDAQQEDYFKTSGDTIRFFFEDNTHNKVVNKIGHALHDLDRVFRHFSYHPLFLAVSTALGMRVPTIVQSMYIFKQPQVGGAVRPHQDSSFIQTEPDSCLGIWVGLEEATTTNGCLYVVPKSHLDPKGVRQRFNKDEEGNLTFDNNDVDWNLDGAVPLEVPEGSVVLINGRTVHYSELNKSEKSRHAYTLHIVEKENKWLKTNWLQRPNRLLPFFPFTDNCKIEWGEEIINVAQNWGRAYNN
eukprot:GHVN01067971.1.p1 GENE.GHVN01067971.1~~GHVN01067971.1.p1  ORF type:complete len:304 (+),score=32.31 GHVN01067971.1:67-978(+)